MRQSKLEKQGLFAHSFTSKKQVTTHKIVKTNSASENLQLKHIIKYREKKIYRTVTQCNKGQTDTS